MLAKLNYIFVVICLSLFCQYYSAAQNKDFVIVLDAGHGGKDPGKETKSSYQEKDIALDIVLKIGSILENKKGINVIYTRKKDVFVTLRGRAEIANKADADLFVSVHCNAHNSQAYGVETFVLGLHANEANFNVAKAENEVIFLEEDYEMHYEGFDPNSPESLIGLTLMQEDYLDQSILLARYVQDNFIYNLKRKNRGVKQAGFWVLHNTYMPSILIETGFITNKNEGYYLNSKKGKTEIAKAVSDAIVKYNKTLIEPEKTTTESVDTSHIEPKDEIYPNITFKIQIAAIKRRLSTKAYNFNGLRDISRTKEKGWFKYYYGETSNYTEIKRWQLKAKDKGYPDCFIVAFKRGKKISLSKALKSKSKLN